MGDVLRVAVMGSNDIEDFETVSEVIEKTVLCAAFDPDNPYMPTPYTGTVLLSGGGKHGVDAAATEWAERFSTSVVVFKPAFMVDGKSEHRPRDFPMRRLQMVDNADLLLVIQKPGDASFDSYKRRALKNGITLVVQEVV